MSNPSGAQRTSVQPLSPCRGWAILLAILIGIASAAALPPAAPAAAATAPKVAIIVGPAGSNTALFRDLANKAAAEARRYTSNVVRVSSPNATWSRVKTAIRGAAIVVYLGRGREFPSPYSSTLRRSTQDGFGLNPVAGANNSTTKYYGENYVRTVPLAPNAVVLLSHVRYASGNGEAGRPQPTRSVARRRVDNYGAGFLAAGASAVIAEATGSPVYYIRTIFTRDTTLSAMWRGSPTFHGHVTSFSSTRTRGAVGRTDPVHATSGYYRSIVGHPATTTATVRTGSTAPTPTPTPAPAASTGVYGSAQGDSRNNHEIGATNRARLAYRFLASTTSATTSIRVQQRGGSGYSGGNGGTIRVSLQADSNGVPSGTILSSLTFAPGNPSGNWEVWDKLTFPAPATLTAGRLYHVVFDNVSADPTANWISLNALFYWGALTPRQPTFSNDYAVLYAKPTTWAVQSRDTPIFDLAYANGVHDGMNYIGSMGPNYGSISGPANLVREHFTVSGGDRTVSSASVKVKRISGTSPLAISLRRGDGTVVESGSVPASAIPLGDLPTSSTAAALGGSTWATVNFAAPRVLANGATYDLVLSTDAGTQYVAIPVQEGTTKGMLSPAFTDGDGQRSTDGGATWSYLYPYLDNGRQDLQFYLR